MVHLQMLQKTLLVPQKVDLGITMIQQFYFWVYIQKNWKWRLEYIFVHHVHSSFTHNCQKVEITQVCTDRWTDKQNVVHIFNGILISPKGKDILTQTTTCMNYEDIMLSDTCRCRWWWLHNSVNVLKTPDQYT